MKSKADPDFWKCFDKLPVHVQRTSHRRYQQWLEDPYHPSLGFKEVKPSLWSVRVTDDYRALGVKSGDSIVWTWIGPHHKYNRLIK